MVELKLVYKLLRVMMSSVSWLYLMEGKRAVTDAAIPVVGLA